MVIRKPFPSQQQRNQFKRELDECLDRCYEEEARTGIEPTAELVELYALKVKDMSGDAMYISLGFLEDKKVSEKKNEVMR